MTYLEYLVYFCETWHKIKKPLIAAREEKVLPPPVPNVTLSNHDGTRYSSVDGPVYKSTYLKTHMVDQRTVS